MPEDLPGHEARDSETPAAVVVNNQWTDLDAGENVRRDVDADSALGYESDSQSTYSVHKTISILGREFVELAGGLVASPVDEAPVTDYLGNCGSTQWI